MFLIEELLVYKGYMCVKPFSGKMFAEENIFLLFELISSSISNIDIDGVGPFKYI